MDQEFCRQIAEIQADHWWYEGRRRILRSVIERLHLPKSAHILEAGCGTGANLNMLRRFGDVKCFDPDDWARDAAQKRYGMEVLPGTLPDGLPFSQKFDLVCAFDVIEHIDDDVGSLAALCNALAPEGRAVFTVPAYMFLWSRHDDFNQHKRRYTRSGFADVLRKGGFEIEFISYYNTLLFPLVLGIRVLKNLLRIKDQTDMEILRRGIGNKILLAIFSAEKYLLRLAPMPFGVSIIAVCRGKTA